MNLAPLDTALKAVCPVHGVSVGVRTDKSTWRVDFKPEANAQQQADAQAVVASFDTALFDASDARDASVDSAIAGDSVVAQLKAMTAAEFDAWWTANVTNAAQAIGVLKRIARVVLRRLL